MVITMELAKKTKQLTDRLNYIRDIFGGKHQDDISLLETRLKEFQNSSPENFEEFLSSLEDLFLLSKKN